MITLFVSLGRHAACSLPELGVLSRSRYSSCEHMRRPSSLSLTRSRPASTFMFFGADRRCSPQCRYNREGNLDMEIQVWTKGERRLYVPLQRALHLGFQHSWLRRRARQAGRAAGDHQTEKGSANPTRCSRTIWRADGWPMFRPHHLGLAVAHVPPTIFWGRADDEDDDAGRKPAGRPGATGVESRE